jgi:hypothetical protein
MSANLSTSAAGAGRTGAQLGEYRLGQLQWRLRIADAYQATGPHGPATVLVLHAAVAGAAGVADALAQQARALAAAPEHKHLARVLGGGDAGGTLYVAVEALDGSNVRDALARKQQNNQGGFGARGAGNLVSAAAGALTKAGVVHGALAAESMVVTRAGGVRLIDLVLGPATVAAVRANVLDGGGWLAPELAAGHAASPASDTYGLGALLYEALIGRPLERGGPRPSEAVSGITPQVDELIARACHRDADKRFGSAQVFGELCAEALGRGAVLSDEQTPIPGSDKSSPSVLHARASAQQAAVSGVRGPSLAESISRPPAAGAAAQQVDRALAAALADSTEKWLVSKGRLDYGPFSLADIVEQIKKGDIVSGNVVIDKDTGARTDVAAHPLLSALIDAAKAQRDEQRRAQAEVAHQGREKRRGVVLYGGIGLGVIGLAIGVYFIVQAARGDKKTEVAGISTLGDATLKVNLSLPKKPPKKARTGGSSSSSGGQRSSSGGPDTTGLGGNADQMLDLSGEDEDEGSETLSMDKVYATYSKYGGQLGGCLQSNGGGSANLSIIIDGKSGKVTWLRVNGEKSGGLFNCMGKVMKRMSFPAINGPRTRAEFDISI